MCGLNIDKDELKSKYIEENMTVQECAVFFGCGKTSIIRYLKKYRITKPKQLMYKNISKANTVHNRTLIKKLYTQDNLTRQQIATQMSIKPGAVNKILASEHCLKTQQQKKELLIKIHDNKETLENLYITQNKTLNEMCEYYGTGHTAIRRALSANKIKKPETLRLYHVLKTFIKTGKANMIGNTSVKDIAKTLGLSITCINKFLKHHDSLTTEEKIQELIKIRDGLQSSLETKFSLETGLVFCGKKNEVGYKPDFNLTEDVYINIDGLYWHSELRTKSKHYHFQMRQTYEKNNKRILQFREDEVNFKLPIIKSIIENILENSIKIFARKTVVQRVSQKDANVFLNKAHMMGSINAKHIGLYHNDTLVCIASYKKHKTHLKIERFCSALGCSIVGGFSKLLKQIENETKVSEIHYWVDLRYGTGLHLLNKGFTFSHETLGWKWTDFQNTFNRQSVKANKDSRKLSEREYANELGLVKVYDAGQRLFKKVNYV
jgi:predicted transcriptional regulator